MEGDKIPDLPLKKKIICKIWVKFERRNAGFPPGSSGTSFASLKNGKILSGHFMVKSPKSGRASLKKAALGLCKIWVKQVWGPFSR